MECNKDEAERCRELAEARFAAQDLDGAKKLVVKAEALYPGLEGIQQLAAVLDVHLTALVTFGTDSDWYGVLRVEQVADDSTIRKQYRKLALALHPDKNRLAGAEAAFKIVGEAFAVLSDKDRRARHDAVRQLCSHAPRRVRANAPKTAAAPRRPRQKQSEPASPRKKRAATPEKKAASPQKKSAAPVPPPKKQAAPTFSTSCPKCSETYVYVRLFKNSKVACIRCKTSFVATDSDGNDSKRTKCAKGNHDVNVEDCELPVKKTRVDASEMSTGTPTARKKLSSFMPVAPGTPER